MAGVILNKERIKKKARILGRLPRGALSPKKKNQDSPCEGSKVKGERRLSSSMRDEIQAMMGEFIADYKNGRKPIDDTKNSPVKAPSRDAYALLKDVRLAGNTAADIVKFCDNWTDLVSDETNISPSEKYKHFLSKLRQGGSGHDGRFLVLWKKSLEICGEDANKRLDYAIAELRTANLPTWDERYEAISSRRFNPLTEDGMTFCREIVQMHVDCPVEVASEEANICRLANLGRVISEKIMSGLAEAGLSAKSDLYKQRLDGFTSVEKLNTDKITELVRTLFPKPLGSNTPANGHSFINDAEVDDSDEEHSFLSDRLPVCTHCKKSHPGKCYKFQKRQKDKPKAKVPDSLETMIKSILQKLDNVGIKGAQSKTEGGKKTEKQKVSTSLIVLQCLESGKNILVDSGSTHSALFTKEPIDCSGKDSCQVTNTHGVGGARRQILLNQNYKILDVTLPSIRIDRGKRFRIGGRDIDVFLGEDFLELCGGYSVKYKNDEVSKTKLIQFDHLPDLTFELIREFTVKQPGRVRQAALAQLTSDAEGSEITDELDAGITDAEFYDIPPDGQVVQEWEFKDVRLKEVAIAGRPNRFIYEWLWNEDPYDPDSAFKDKLGDRFKPNIFNKTAKEHLLLLAQALKQWEDEKIMVPVRRADILSTIAIIPVIQLHKTTPVRAVLNAIFLNKLMHSYPSGDTKFKPPSCPHVIRMIRAVQRPEQWVSVDINKAFLQIFADFTQSFYQCLDVDGLGLKHQFYRLVRLPFGLSIAPKVLKIVISIILERAGVTQEVIDYVDDLFMREQTEPVVREFLKQYGFTCKPAQRLLESKTLGMSISKGKFRRGRPLKSFAEIVEGRQPTVRDVKRFVGGLACHFPIAGQLRPISLFLLRFQADIERLTKQFRNGINVEPRSKQFGSAWTSGGRSRSREQKRLNRAPAHPAILACIAKVEQIIAAAGDPVTGQFSYNLLGSMDVYADASKYATGAVVKLDGVKVEDGAWSRKGVPRLQMKGDKQHHINIAELDGMVQSLKIVSRYLTAIDEHRSRNNLSLRPSEYPVTMYCDNSSARVWAAKAIQGRPLIIPELSRRLATNRIDKIVRFASQHSVKLRVLSIRSELNPADILSRVPPSLLAIAKKFYELVEDPERLKESIPDPITKKVNRQQTTKQPVGTCGERSSGSHCSPDCSNCYDSTLDEATDSDLSDVGYGSNQGIHRVTDKSALEDRSPGTILVSMSGRVKSSAGEAGDPINSRGKLDVTALSYWLQDTDIIDLIKRVKRSTHRFRSRRRTKVRCFHTNNRRNEFEFGQDGLRILASDTDLQEILTVVHKTHQGADELYKVVRGIVSIDSQLPTGGLRQICRDFVDKCITCTMCKVKPAGARSASANQVDMKLLKYLPVRLDAHGRVRAYSATEVEQADRLMKQLRKLKLAAQRNSKSLRYRKGSRPGHVVHMDIVGPWQFGSNNVYLITLLDSYSNFGKVQWIENCPNSAACIQVLREFCDSLQYYVDTIITDNGKVFTSREFVAYADSIRARIVYVGTYAHWANGKIERFHRVLNERVRCGIYDEQKKLLASMQASGFRIDSVQVELVVIRRILDSVVLGWNATPRAQRKSPHSLVLKYPAWIYPQIDAYRPKQLAKQFDELEIVDEPRFPGDKVPQVGEWWSVRVRPGEHPISSSGNQLAVKLQPQNICGEIVAIEDKGRYLLRIGQRRDQLVRKERKQLLKRVDPPTGGNRYAEVRIPMQSESVAEGAVPATVQVVSQTSTVLDSLPRADARCLPLPAKRPLRTPKDQVGAAARSDYSPVSRPLKRLRLLSGILRDPNFVTTATVVRRRSLSR
jgi:transposase InsO family protein